MQGDVEGCKQCAEQQNPSVVIELLDAAASGRLHSECFLEGKNGSCSPATWPVTFIRKSASRISAESGVPLPAVQSLG